MASFSWIHLSDLHMQEKDSFDRSRVMEALFEDIEQRGDIDLGLKLINAVFFTGDLAYHGYKKEYELAISEFVDPLLKKLNIGKDKLFFVPGNHDIDITKFKSYAQGWQKNFKSGEDVTRFLESDEDMTLLKPRIQGYEENFLKPITDQELRTPGLFYTAKLIIDNKNISVLCLNSAWICTGNEDDKACLGERQLVEALKLSNMEEPLLRIAVFHHPVGKWKETDDLCKCERLLEKNCGLWLSGHTHKANIRSVSSPFGKYVPISAGAVFDKRKSPLSYNYGLLDLATGKGKVFYRTYFTDSNEWGADIGATGKEHNGKMPIHIEGLGSPMPKNEDVSPEVCTLPSGDYGRALDPFCSVTAESMNADEITRFFVGHHTKIDIAEKRFGTIIEGQRGTGKSMLLKYLSYPVQIRAWKAKGRDTESYFNEKRFIGVYCKLQQGVYDKRDLEHIPDTIKRGHIFEHRLTADICVQILMTMKEVTTNLGLLSKRSNGIENRLGRIQSAPKEWIDNASSLPDILDVYRDVLRQQTRSVDEYLRDYEGSSFTPFLTLSGFLYDMIVLFKETLGLDHCCIFLLLDDFDVLHNWQQEALFAIAAQRRFDLVCFKLGVMSEGIKVRTAGEGRTFRPGDDYDHVFLDMIERGLLRKDYPDAVTLIAAKRIKESAWLGFSEKIPQLSMNVETDEGVIKACDTILRELFPIWEHGKIIRREIKSAMEKEWKDANPKPTKAKNDYFSKYGNARYFQRLRQLRQYERYAGYDYMVAISSGIVRQFLEICSHTVSEAYKDHWNHIQGAGISAEIQDRAMIGYSKAFFDNLNKGAGAHGELSKLGYGVTSQDVADLIEALCDLFYERLHYAGHREPEIITFSLKNSSEYVENLLKVCVRESVLQKFTYPPKTAGQTQLPAYALNKRLVPRRSISALRMQGRIEMTASDIESAVKDRGYLIKRFMPKKSSSQLSLGITGE